MANSGNIENQINKFLKLFGCENIDELLNKTQTQKDTLSVFIQKYLFYDMCGFRSDRNRTMENISTDAKHAFYGSYCDVYVTMDAKSREKTEAIYKSTGIKTNVVDFKDFISYMENHIRRLVNISNYYDDCCNNLPGNYLDNVEDLKVRPCYFDNPLFGFFNIGYPIIHNHKEHVVFKRILKGRSIVFYSEIDCFINLFKVITDADFIQILEEYKTCLKNGNGDSKPFVIIYENYTMVFGTDYEDARLPMIIVSKSK